MITKSNTSPWRRGFLSIGLVLILGSLATLKFYDFLASELESLAPGTINIHLPRIGLATPVGFSFYAFMAASYLIDVYSNKTLVERNAGKLALYVSFFPKILAGPIERATALLPQIRESLHPSPEMMVAGMQLIGWGMFKKVVIAGNLAPFVDRTFSIAAYASPVDLLTSSYFFAFQIYCDFSGYSDMAIGIALLFGIRLMENFKRPYFSTSISVFWSSRWRISLGHWFRDYHYKPLGGRKFGTFRQYFNVMLVFIVSGRRASDCQ
jgi:D-alanyl-lipoteichoic acid acyltransferase DltB (MBOAT superfamily)